jgi:hypothetical protein
LLVWSVLVTEILPVWVVCANVRFVRKMDRNVSVFFMDYYDDKSHFEIIWNIVGTYHIRTQYRNMGVCDTPLRNE